jgi:hypothetical protein
MMKSRIVLSLVLAVALTPAALAQQSKPTGPATEQQPKGQQPATNRPDPDFAYGTVETVVSRRPLVIVIRATEMTDRVRAMKLEGRLTVEIPAEALKGNPVPRPGDVVTVRGVVRDGRFVIMSVSVGGAGK